MQSIRTVTTKIEQFFSIKNRPVTRSHSVRTSLSSSSERSLWNVPLCFLLRASRTLWKAVLTQQNDICSVILEWQNWGWLLQSHSSVLNCYIVIIYSSLVQKHKNGEQHLEIYLIPRSEINGLTILPIIFWRQVLVYRVWWQSHAGSSQNYCMKRMLKAITIQHMAT